MTALPLKLLYVAGFVRSGSTLLDRVLGGVEGFVSTGELRDIWIAGFQRNWLCGCRLPFRECPFWGAVIEDAFGGFDRVDVDRAVHLRRRVDQWWRAPQLMAPRRSARMEQELREYGALLYRLYAGIRAVSGCNVVVNSTKAVSHGFVLTLIREPIDLFVLHLIRDSRAVTHSLRGRVYDMARKGDLPVIGTPRAALAWDVSNLLAEATRAKTAHYARLRYERFTSRPVSATRGIVRFVGEADAALPFDADGRADLPTNHTVAGNPNRYEEGPVTIRTNDRWRTEMPPWRQVTATAITLPLLIRYGFLSGRQHGGGRGDRRSGEATHLQMDGREPGSVGEHRPNDPSRSMR